MTERQKNRRHGMLTLVFAGLMTAMNVLLGKFLVIDIGDIGRISLSAVPVLLSGAAFGPAWGAAVGFSGDLLGCLLKGYAVNPIILVGSTFVGFAAGLFRWQWLRKAGYLRALALTAASVVPSSAVIKTIGLKVFFGTPLKALLLTRLPVVALEVPIVALIMTVLFNRREMISLIEKARRKEDRLSDRK